MSAAGDETRKGESITDAAATRSVMPQADGSASIALQRDSSPPQFSWSRRAHKNIRSLELSNSCDMVS